MRIFANRLMVEYSLKGRDSLTGELAHRYLPTVTSRFFFTGEFYIKQCFNLLNGGYCEGPNSTYMTLFFLVTMGGLLRGPRIQIVGEGYGMVAGSGRE
jgi:hypothetical protein